MNGLGGLNKSPDGVVIGLASLSPLERDVHFLRRSFDVARRAVTHGNHPFGALLVDQNGTVLIEVENGYMPSP